MPYKRALATGAALAVLAGAELSIQRDPAKGSALFDPAASAQALCTAQGGLDTRRSVFLGIARSYAQASAMNPDAAKDTAPLGIAAMNWPISTSRDEAQAAFDAGVAHMANFNHHEAVRAFRAGQAADPDCAMCFWGEATALGMNINAPFDPETAAAAMAAADRAQALAAGAGQTERALIEALGERFAQDENGTVTENPDAYASAMDEVARTAPEDDFVAILAAEANMNTQPWDYWETNGFNPKGRAKRSIELLEGVLARTPEHPQAIHLYIHMTEASADPYRAEPYADVLAGLAPDYGHLVHMPSHVYYRLGRWKKSLAHNDIAIAADEAYLAGAEDPSVMYRFGYYPHNVHFALTSALMGGNADVALLMADKLNEALPPAMASPAPIIEIVKAAPYYAAARFQPAEAVLALAEPPGDHPFLHAAWHYARGEAMVVAGDGDGARTEAAAIRALIDDPRIPEMDAAFVAATQVLRLSALTIEARAAAAQGDLSTAIALMEEAVSVEATIPYMEPPFWYYPARQTLGAYVLLDGQADRAERLFRETLLQSPNNAYALFGLAEAYRALGDRRSAAHAEHLFKEAWMGGKRADLTLARL